MSEQAARAALSRMNMREVMVAPVYTGLATDLQELASADPESQQKKFLAQRAELCAAYGYTASEQRKPFAFAEGLAIIPVSGTLINRFGSSWGYVTGYNFIRSQLSMAMADDDVKGVILDINSYGGEAAGCFELAADIRAARDKKPITAIVDSNAYSAGYAIASAATKVVATPSAGVGSVGVITMHVDQSEWLAKVGIKVTLIYEAEHKADGNPFEALSDEVKADIKASIHKSYEAFVDLVATNLGMDAKKVRDTQSRTYRADDALALGFIHAIATPSQAAQAFLGELSGSNHQLRQGAHMSTQTTEPGADQKALAETAAANAAKEARTSERARMSGIMGCDEAKGREALANHFAMNTDMSVEDAKAALAVAPKAAAEAPAAKPNAFAAAMEASGNPNVGADAAAAEGSGTADPVAAILQAQSMATGVKLSK